MKGKITRLTKTFEWIDENFPNVPRRSIEAILTKYYKHATDVEIVDWFEDGGHDNSAWGPYHNYSD